jgi:hypothetical protein
MRARQAPMDIREKRVGEDMKSLTSYSIIVST